MNAASCSLSPHTVAFELGAVHVGLKPRHEVPKGDACDDAAAPPAKKARCAGMGRKEAFIALPSVGRTPKGAYSTRGRSRHLLETPFSEPLLRTLLRTLFYCKTHSRPPSQNSSENPFPRTLSPEPSQNPSQNAVLPYDPLGVHPVKVGFARNAPCAQGLTKPTMLLEVFTFGRGACIG